MSTCIIHIGTEKTGTTFLQNWLYENDHRLKKQGVSLTRTAGYPNNRKLVAYLQENFDDYHAENRISGQTDRDHFFEGFKDQFTDEVKTLSQRYEAVILTSEHFHSRFRTQSSVTKLHDLLAPYFSEFRIVCYFREQSKVRTSLYSTTLTVQNTVSLEEFQKDVDPSSDYYNYLKFFEKWERVFGKTALKPRLYEPGRFFGDDLRLDFLQAALPELKPGKLSFNQSSANASVSRSVARLFRTINKARPRFIEGVVDPTPMAFRQAVRSLGALRGSAPLVDNRQNEMFWAFNNSNVKFFERFFGKAYNLFAPPLPIQIAEPEELFTLVDIEELLRSLLVKPNLIVITDEDVNLLCEAVERLAHSKAENERIIRGLERIAARAKGAR